MHSTRTCAHCHQPLAWDARSDARYCSVRCRVAAHRARRPVCHIPAALTARDRWVRHDRKRPITVKGYSASSTNATTWAPYTAALASHAGDGLGFVLNGDGIVCVDLDHCLEGGTPSPLAASILAACPATYVEISPSGHGLHIWGLADLPASFTRPGVEVYGNGRYITITGQPYRDAPSTLASIGALLAAL